MNRRESVKKPASAGKSATRRAGTRIVPVLAVVAAVSMLIAWSGSAVSAGGDQGQVVKAKKYKATRPFVPDKQTGEIRMPTQQEVDEIVSNLDALGQRPTETLQQSAQANGAVSLDLDGGFGGIVLGRPNADGTWETKCVFTVEEGAEFLGLVEDDSAR